MSEVLILSLRLSPVTLQRKLTWAACVCSLILSVTTKLMIVGKGWNVDQLVNRKLCIPAQCLLHHSCLRQCPHYCWRRTNPPVNLTLHFTFTRKQDPKSLEPSLGAATKSQPEGSNSPWPQTWRLWSGEVDRTTSSAKSREAILRSSNRTLFSPWWCLEKWKLRQIWQIQTTAAFNACWKNAGDEKQCEILMITTLSLSLYLSFGASVKHYLNCIMIN